MPNNNPFPPELRTAAVVPRWSIVWTLTRDTLTNHSFFVTFYANQIAKIIMWKGDCHILMYRALTDDLEETVTGDMPSPVKKEIVDNLRAATYVDVQMLNRLGTVAKTRREQETLHPQTCDEADLIIKAADRLDALIFLMIERRLGNGAVAPSIPKMRALMEEAWFNLPADKDKLTLLWNTLIVNSIDEHATNGGWGI